MKCEQCEKEATVHLTQVVDGAVKKLHLCEACAGKSGFDIQGPVSITDILLGMEGEPAKPRTSKKERACPVCRMKRSDFKKSGRLGCPSCYEAFSEDLASLIRAMQRSSQHLGKVPKKEEHRVKLTAELAQIRKQLDQAVAAEAYEEAAELRDRIQVLTQEMKKEPSGEQAHDAG